MTLKIEITEDGQKRGLFELPARGSFVLGRHESCELVVKGSGVSRRHALLSVYKDEYAVQDLASKNGTYVNGKEAKTEILLADGDTIRLGRAVLLRVSLSNEPAKAKKIEATAPQRMEQALGSSIACEACDAPIDEPAPSTGVLALDDGSYVCAKCTASLSSRERIADRYRVVAKIGEGSVATVEKAIDEEVRRIVAVKMTKAKVSDLVLSYLEREVEILRELDHPGIVRLFDAGEHKGNRWLVMELVHGSDLESVIETRERLSAEDAAHVGFALASALSLAHRRGVVHRDVKPSNVLIDREGVVKLVDFGVARLKASGTRKASERLTVRGSRRGTPAYMSPEQALDPANAGPQADVYSVGATLYHAMAGAPPYGAKASQAQILEKLDRGEPPEDFEGSQSSANLGLTTVVRRAMEHDPKKRFPDADALRAALGQLLPGPPRLGELLSR